MHLRTLTLRGFKSFASATTLHFEPGITCVVGPNGSGKSNVVDALAWVMGEQGAKSLRGGAMADVIFAGTTSRPPLGRAEVALTIDNTDGALPIAYSEVTISRTLFRNGGSEYAINGSPCRLLDIQELLSDTGMGREMHVIVGQGQLDAVLSASPEDRRGFIEEAAGVLKHRRRKDRALRKLDAMQAKLQRVTDLASEIRRQLGPLARQADVARRAARIQADVHDSRARLLADDLVQAIAQLEAEAQGDEQIHRRKAEVEEAAAAARVGLADAEVAAAHAAPRTREATDSYYLLAGIKERFTSLLNVAAERARNLGSPLQAALSEDPEELEGRARAVRQELETLAKELDQATGALEEAVRLRGAAEEEERAQEHALAAVHRALADRREGLARLTGKVAARRSRLEAAQGELERARATRAQAEERAQAAEREYAEKERDVAGREIGEVDLDAAYEAAAAAEEAAAGKLAALRERERELRGTLAQAEARAQALALSLTRSDATGTLIESGKLTHALPEKLQVSGGWGEAISAALGPLADAAVAPDLARAHRCLQSAREGELGTVRIVIPGGPLAAPALPPGTTPAASVVEADASVSGLVGRLLAGVVLVEDAERALQVVSEHPELTAVTRSGDLLAADRAIGGGGGGGSVYSLQAAAEQTQEVISATRRDLETTRFQLVGAQDTHEAAADQAASALSSLHASDAAYAAVTEQLGRLASAIRSARAEAERAGPILERLAAESAEHERELAELAARLDRASKTPQEGEADLEAASGQRDRANAAASLARHQETDARLKVRTIEERMRALTERAASLESAAQVERAARARAQEQERIRATKARIAGEVRERASSAVVRIDRSLAQANEVRLLAEEERDRLAEVIKQRRGELEELGSELSKLTDAAHREEVVRAEQRLRRTQLEERAVGELGIDPEVLVEEYGPHLLVPSAQPEEEGAGKPYVRAEQERRLAAASRDLQRLGKVNPLALEEHAALNERHQFLTEQVADLRKSRADLMQIVGEIDERVERVFSGAFQDTAREFAGVFSRLFPGGEGKLILTDPEDMLATGIEIEARPAGKKVKRLSLLSGGERSLTAVALLIAIFRARPSPFYVMDEVEAALDDTNLTRLLEIFRELKEDSQLLVVTHQKRTMEVADALYGVTMKDGVTAVISQRVGENSQ